MEQQFSEDGRETAQHSRPPRRGLGRHWERGASSEPAAPGGPLLRGPAAPGALLLRAPGPGPASADSVSLVLSSHKGSIIKGLSRGSLLGLRLPAPFIWQQWAGLLLWVNCLPLQLMNLCGLPFVCFPGVRINERSRASAAEERRGKRQGRGGLGMSGNTVIRFTVSVFIRRLKWLRSWI